MSFFDKRSLVSGMVPLKIERKNIERKKVPTNQPKKIATARPKIQA